MNENFFSLSPHAFADGEWRKRHVTPEMSKVRRMRSGSFVWHEWTSKMYLLRCLMLHLWLVECVKRILNAHLCRHKRFSVEALKSREWNSSKNFNGLDTGRRGSTFHFCKTQLHLLTCFILKFLFGEKLIVAVSKLTRLRP